MVMLDHFGSRLALCTSRAVDPARVCSQQAHRSTMDSLNAAPKTHWLQRHRDATTQLAPADSLATVLPYFRDSAVQWCRLHLQHPARKF